MAINPLGMNQGTQSFIRFEDDGGTINTQVIDVRQGSVDVTSGTVTVSNPTGTTVTVDHGTVTLSNPTGTTVQFNNGTVDLLKAGTITRVEGGTVGLVTRVGNVGTLEVGTISSIPNIPGGTVNLVSNIGNGSIRITTGTVTTGNGGTDPTAFLPVRLTDGTSFYNAEGGAGGGTTVTVDHGSIVITAGTINAGTVRTDARTTQNIVTYGTQIGASGAIAATVIGSAAVGVGTSLWVDNFSIINPSGTVLVTLGFGTAQQGTNVLFRGVLGTQTTPGIQKTFAKLTNAGMTNQDLVLSLDGAGTVDLSTSYIISA